MVLSMKMFLIFCAFSGFVASEENPQCSCGVYIAPTSEKTTQEPFMSKSPNFPIQCETDGVANCAKMCTALAEAAKETGPKVLCEKVGTTTTPITPLIYSKACGETTWVDTGLKSTLRVCCADKAVVQCAS